MTRSIASSLRLGVIVSALLFPAVLLVAQELQPEQKSNFFDVQVSKDEIYTYKNLQFTGDFTSFESPSGKLALGRTEAGVTIVIVLGPGTYTIESPEAAQEKMKTVFGMYPVKGAFKSIYMRLSPKEYEETIGQLSLTKTDDEDSFTRSKDLFGQKFLASYHAGPKAMLPPYRTRVIEFDTEAFGWIFGEEGYWLTLRRMSPYASIYPPKFVNPKQR